MNARAAPGRREGAPPVPRHVAIIMDGNGRWAARQKLPRIKGHEAGVESVQAAVRACKTHGIRYLTLYAFSVENWVRPAGEVRGLMRLLRLYLQEHLKDLQEQGIRFRAIGRLDDLMPAVRRELRKASEATRNNDGGDLILALSYGGRAEIVDAARALARRVRAGELAPDQIDEAVFAGALYAPDVPDPDLLIRTSGELRLSNFLLWQLSYTECYFTRVLWPDFREAHFRRALEAYARRGRRFGGVEAKSC